MSEEQFKNKIVRQIIKGKDCLTFSDNLVDGREIITYAEALKKLC